MAAIIENVGGEILLARRGEGKHLAGCWEFPGGKVEPGESEEAAIRRELIEELQLHVQIRRRLGDYDYRYDWGEIRLTVFVVAALNEPAATVDVREFKWIVAKRVTTENLAPADVQALQDYLSGT